jgi:triacylglycerol lipase
MIQTAIYTKHDGIVDWRYCMTKNPNVDFEVPGAHVGMDFNPLAYTIIGERLAMVHTTE